ncbi:MAG: RNA polymerase sigma factor [Planctomycetota bacterium]
MIERTDFDPAQELAFVDAFLAGHRGTVQRFSERLSCVPRMLAARNAKLGRPLDAEELNDVVQDTFLTVLRRLPSYRPDAPLESWIYGICCLQLRSALRRRARTNQGIEALADDDPEAPGRSTLGLLEDAVEVHAMLEMLGGIEADVIRMKHLDGVTFDELGARLELSPNTVKTYYYRGLAALRRIVERRSERPDGDWEQTA